MIEGTPPKTLRRGFAEKTIDSAAQPTGVRISYLRVVSPAILTPSLAKILIKSGTLPDYRAVENITPRDKVVNLVAQHLASVSGNYTYL